MIRKQKILIVNNNLNTGGVQKALVNLLKEIKDLYDVTLFTFSFSGEYKSSLPEQVKVIEANRLLKLLGISQIESKKDGFFFYFIRAGLVVWTKLFGNTIPFKFMIAFEKKIEGFDVVISYLHSSNDKTFYGGCNEFVLEKVDAKQKITYVHCDYIKNSSHTPKNKKVYLKFDKIITVSNGCKNNFLKAIPELKTKTFTVQNLTNYEEIKLDSKRSPIKYPTDKFNIVTVSRLSDEKGIIRGIEVINQLINKGFKICWHIIGNGNLRKKISDLVHSKGLSNDIFLYGNQQNPYKYMKNANLFFLPSYHEAAPMVFEEAKFLGIPILATHTTSTKEMIEDCNAGWVCENSEFGIIEKLEYIITNTKELSNIKERLLSQQFSNVIGIEQFNQTLRAEL